MEAPVGISNREGYLRGDSSVTLPQTTASDS